MCFCWPIHQPSAAGSMPTAPRNSFVESPSTIPWFFSVGFFAFSHHFYFLSSWACCDAVGASGSNCSSQEQGSWGAAGQTQPCASGTSTALPHNLAVSSEVKAKAVQQGHTKMGLGPQRAEHIGKVEIAVQTSGSSAGDGSDLPPHNLPLKLACDDICYWNWVRFRGLEKMKHDKQKYPMVTFSHPGRSII